MGGNFVVKLHETKTDSFYGYAYIHMNIRKNHRIERNCFRCIKLNVETKSARTLVFYNLSNWSVSNTFYYSAKYEGFILTDRLFLIICSNELDEVVFLEIY